jgi:hypothetical protein
MSDRKNELAEVFWLGRQWAVTLYGLETIAEPYHYFLEARMLGSLRQGERAYDSMVHMMEKDWLDVDDFLTAYLIALSFHGIRPDPVVIKTSVHAALSERRRLCGSASGASSIGTAFGGRAVTPKPIANDEDGPV